MYAHRFFVIWPTGIGLLRTTTASVALGVIGFISEGLALRLNFFTAFLAAFFAAAFVAFAIAQSPNTRMRPNVPCRSRATCWHGRVHVVSSGRQVRQHHAGVALDSPI
jgi:hypothetical protein